MNSRNRQYRLFLFLAVINICFISQVRSETTPIDEVHLGTGTTPMNVDVLDVPAVKRAYFPLSATASVAILTAGSPATGSVYLNSGAASPYDVAVFNDLFSPKVYVTNLDHDTVSVIDASGGTDVELTGAQYPIPVQSDPMGIGVLSYSGPSHKIYVANSTSNTVSVINGDTHATSTIVTISGFNMPYDIAVNDVTQKIYVTNSMLNSISVIDGTTDTIVDTIYTGSQPRGIAVDETTNTIFVANYSSYNIYAIDGATGNQLGTLPVAGAPDMIEVMPEIGLVYVSLTALGKIAIFKATAPFNQVSGSPLLVGDDVWGLAGARSIPGEPWQLFAACSGSDIARIIEETDSYAPEFEGLTTAVDAQRTVAGGGPALYLNWAEATDVSAPIVYNIYKSDTSGGQDFGTAPFISTATFGTVTVDTGIQYASMYYFVVRASDSANVPNEDENVVEFSVMPTDGEPPTGGIITNAIDVGYGGEVLLTWSLATDDTPGPILYNIYIGNSTSTLMFHSATDAGGAMSITGLNDNVEYYFNVRAQDAAGIVSTNTTTFATTPTDIAPPVFAGLDSATDTGAGGEVALTWVPATDRSNPIMYEGFYEAGAAVTSFSTPAFTTSNGGGHTVTGLTDGTQYAFVVRARDDAGNSDTNIATQTVTPTDVSDPYFTGIASCMDLGQNGKIKLLWAGASDNSTPIYYNVYKATASNTFNFASIDYQLAATTTYTVENATNGEELFFTVRAQDSAAPPNEDGNVAQCSAIPTDGAAPTFSGVSSATATGNTGEVTLTWTAATDESSPIYYNIYRATTSGGQTYSSWTYQTSATTTYTATSLTDGQEYFFVVRAEDTGGLEENNTAQVSAIPNDGTPPVFGGITGLVDTQVSGALTASWAAAADPATPITYEIYVAESSGGQTYTTPDITTTATSTEISSLANNIPYYVVVRARDAGGIGETNVVELSATPTDQTAPTFGDITSAADNEKGGEIVLGWSAASDPSTPITYYIYQRIPPAAYEYGTPTYVTQSTTYTATGLTELTTYAFTVGVMDNASPTPNFASTGVELQAAPTDQTAPTFSGIASVTDPQTSGALDLTWSAASDNSGIAQYNIYYATTSAVLWTAPKTSVSGASTSATITGLENVYYYVGVRAVDASSNANEDTNTVKLGDGPTDSAAPTFGGITSAVDTTQGGEVTLNWDAASDPGTPITYNVYYAQGATPSFFSPEAATDSSTGITISGLGNNVPYYFVVRAEDVHENETTNTDVTIVTPTDSYDPVFGGITSAVDTTQGGEVTLGWTAATDNSSPITYNIYEATASGGQSFISTPTYSTTDTSYTISSLTDGTLYYYVVRAEDTGGNEEANFTQLSVEPSDQTAPTFGGVAGGNALPKGGAVSLTWSAATDRTTPITYNVYKSTNPAVFNYGAPDASTQGVSIEVDGLTNKTWYYFVVRAQDSAATPNEDSNTIKTQLRPQDTLAPAAPASFTATPGDESPEANDEYVTLEWTIPTTNTDGTTLSDLGGFNVYRSTVTGQYSAPPQNLGDGIDNDGDGYIDDFDSDGDLISATATQYVDNTNITSGTKYYYVVLAVDKTSPRNTSPYSVEKSATPQNSDDATPYPPDNLSATAGDSQVSLQWVAPTFNTDGSLITDLQGYYVYRSISAGSNYQKITSSMVESLTYKDTTATNGTTYYYVVTALDSGTPANESNYSSEASATPLSEEEMPPAAPSGLTVTSGDQTADLAWTAPTTNADGSFMSDLAGYNVYRGTESATGTFSKLNSSLHSSTSYNDTSLTNGTTYYYYVTAVDTDDNESQASSVKIALYGSQGIEGTIEQFDISSGPQSGGYPKIGVPDITVQLLDDSETLIGSAVTDSDGYFKIIYEQGASGDMFSVRVVIDNSTYFIMDPGSLSGGQGYRVVATDVSLDDGVIDLSIPDFGAGPAIGDTNCDGSLDVMDFLSLKAAFGLSTGQTGYLQVSDFNGDLSVDVQDFLVLKKNFGLFGNAPPSSYCSTE